MRDARRIATVATLLFTVSMAGASRADEQNPGAIRGKWGIGAGLGNGSTEFTLIRGHSDRTAWLINTQFAYQRLVQDEAAPPFTSGDQSITQLIIGPGIRRFLAPSSVLSPYLDLNASYLYQRNIQSSGGSNEQTINGAAVGIAGGAEYFTPWRFSVAIHSGFASFTWLQARNEVRTPLGSSSARTRSSQVTAALRPVLFARVYF